MCEVVREKNSTYLCESFPLHRGQVTMVLMFEMDTRTLYTLLLSDLRAFANLC